MQQRSLGALLDVSASGLGVVGRSGFYGTPDEVLPRGAAAGERYGELGMRLADA